MLKRVCGWCGKGMGFKKGGRKRETTHGICQLCKRVQINEIKKSESAKTAAMPTRVSKPT